MDHPLLRRMIGLGRRYCFRYMSSSRTGGNSPFPTVANSNCEFFSGSARKQKSVPINELDDIGPCPSIFLF